MKTLYPNDAVIGITAEYDPFHNGHALHVARARAHLAEEGRKHVPVVAVLSSSFTQRGLPALVDKWTRARMALAGGVDLVLELPFAWACNAGPDFAKGAVDILAAARFVTHLSFGVEDLPLPHETKNPISALHMAVDILIHESHAFKLNLRKALGSGVSYPKAVALALERESPGLGAFVSAPNNSLALSYLLRVREKNYGLVPLPIRREGVGHRDENVRPPFASGTAIRAALAAFSPKAWGRLWLVMPESSLTLLREEEGRGRLCVGATSLLWPLLRGLLVRSGPEPLRECAGMDEGLENLFSRHCLDADSYDDFIGRCVCARYTRNRLQRQITRCLAGLSRAVNAALSQAPPPYIRVLGFNERGRALLRARRKDPEAVTPVITRLAAAGGQIANLAAELEFRASRLRELLLPCPDLRYEEKQKPLKALSRWEANV
ncbi:MAG: nucleotidyltransferase family protein [Synergistaceae bacterium]|jgi:predicted nucleotidyltransferase|nr:nucleotidyltransferase family protein [Synergistaceae bacterium]